MSDSIRLPSDLGRALRARREAAGLSVTAVARRAGRVRDVVYRLENGEDATVASLLAVLAALGLTMRLGTAELPTLEEVRARFENDDDDDAA